jgi:hypothetical protein
VALWCWWRGQWLLVEVWLPRDGWSELCRNKLQLSLRINFILTSLLANSIQQHLAPLRLIREKKKHLSGCVPSHDQLQFNISVYRQKKKHS